MVTGTTHEMLSYCLETRTWDGATILSIYRELFLTSSLD